MSGGNSGGTQTTTSKTALPDQLQPYVAPYLTQAQQAATTAANPQTYDSPLTASLTAPQTTAINGTNTLADQTGQTTGTALGAINTLIGSGGNAAPTQTNQYIGQSNQYADPNNAALQQQIGFGLDQMRQNYQLGTAAQTDSAFNRGSNFGGSAWQEQTGKNQYDFGNNMANYVAQLQNNAYNTAGQLTNADLTRQQAGTGDLNTLNSNNYNTAQARIIGAGSALPSIVSGDTGALNAQLQGGGLLQQQNQGAINQAYGNWTTQQNAPYQSLDVMGNAISRLMGGGGSTTTTGPNPYQSNPFATTLGGAASGAAIGSAIPGVGTLIGAGVGGLGGLLSSVKF